MQISNVSSNPYITAAINSSQSSTNSDKITDYTSMSLDKLRALSYEETKAHIDEIKLNIQNQNTNELSKDMSLELSSYEMTTLKSIDYTKNETFNKTLFNTLKEIKEPIQQLFFEDEVQRNLADYASGKKVQASFMVGDNVHVTEPLTKQQMNRINFDDFLSQMLSNFGNDVATSGGSVKQQYQGIVDGYSLLKQNYDFQKSEPIYA